MSKRVLFIGNNSGGTYDFRHDLMEKMAESCTVAVVIPHGDKEEKFADFCEQIYFVPIERRGMNPLKDIKLYSAYKKILKRFRPDLVITYTIKPNVYGGCACRRLKIPYAANITGLGTAIESGGMLKKLVIFMYKIALKKSKVVFFENSDNRSRAVGMGFMPENKTCVLHGAGVNTKFFGFVPYPNDEIVRFLFVGRLMAEKGVNELFYASEELKKRYGSRIEFHFVGPFEEGFKAEVERLQSEGVLVYHGSQSDVRPFYAKCSAVVLPSYHEGMSNVLLEAASTGRPLITSNIPGCKEAVIDGENGFLCRVKDKNSLLEQMDKFFNLPYEQKAQMSVSSRKHMEDVFGKQKVVAETIKRL